MNTEPQRHGGAPSGASQGRRIKLLRRADRWTAVSAIFLTVSLGLGLYTAWSEGWTPGGIAAGVLIFGMTVGATVIQHSGRRLAQPAAR